jgi:hypothetical protein
MAVWDAGRQCKIIALTSNLWEKCHMRRRKRNFFFNNVLLGTSAFLIYSLRHRLGAVGDLKESVAQGYQTASRRVRKASDVLRGQDRYSRGRATAILLGVPIGVGIGILFAPTSGRETRTDIFEKLKNMRGNVRERSSRREPKRATGTYGNEQSSAV